MARLRTWVLLGGMLLVLLGVAPANTAQASVEGIVISQVYGGGGNSGATYTNDFVELFNAGPAPVTMTGWSVQYASAAGTSWQKTNLVDATLQPGQYYLVQEAAGAGGTEPLPTPDATGSIAMSASAGKIGLFNHQTTQSGATLTGVVDFVGYGTSTTIYEGAAPAPGLNNTTADLRAGGGCVDTDNNSADFSTGAPTPRNTAETFNPCFGDHAPSVSSIYPADGVTGLWVDTNITIDFNEPVDVSAGWFDITCADSGSHTAAVSGGPQTFTLDPDASFSSAEECTVTVHGTLVSDQDTDDPPDAMVGEAAATFTTADLALCGTPATLIHVIQGDGAASPITGETHTIEGTVVGDFQAGDELKGFYVQEESADADPDPLTSEGVFVFDNLFGNDVAVGQQVRVSGKVSEYNGLTEISAVTDVQVCGVSSLPAATAVSLPFAASDSAEPVEGMLVTLPQTLTATEVYSLGRYGEVMLSSGGRLRNPTNVVEPGAPAVAYETANRLNAIILDDGSTAQNPDPTPYLFGGEPTLRLGDTVTGLTGVMSYGFDVYRIEPVTPAPFVRANPRTPTPEDVGGMLKVGSFNLLNYFNGDGVGGGFPTARGANTLVEFNRQRAKTIAAIVAADPDVAGLMEMENDNIATEYSAIEDLVDGLNAATAPDTYAFIDTTDADDGLLGTDAIRVAVIYKTASVEPIPPWATIETGPFLDKSRPPIAQAFREIATGEEFIFVVNHLKSKGSCPSDPTDPEADQLDGQGCWNPTRVESVNELLAWLATDPTGTGDPDILIMGDMNAYAMEDPIDAFVSGGYTNLIDSFIGADAYSYVYNGEAGYLDHALSSPSLTTRITGVTEWHNNSDEPPVLDYNMEYKSADQQALNVDTPFRTSDHDPVIVGMTLGEPVATLSDTSLVFGDQLVGAASAAQVVTVKNDGSLPLVIDPVTISGDFAIDTDTCSLASVPPTESCTIGVTFNPSAIGPLTGALTIPNNAASSPDSVSLEGIGIQPGVSLTPDALDFGSLFVGFTSPAQSVTVANTGSAPLLVSAVTAGDDFALAGGTCAAAPFSLGVGESCTVEVTFAPTSAGPHSASLDVASDAPTSPISASLTGTGLTNELLLNGGFEIAGHGHQDLESWIAKGLGHSEGQDCTVAFEGSCSLKLGGRGKTRAVTQAISVRGGAGENFLFSIQNLADHVRGHGPFEAVITVTYTRGRRDVFHLEFDPGTHDWQAGSLAFTSARAYKKITVTLSFGKDGTTWFDAANLLRVP